MREFLTIAALEIAKVALFIFCVWLFTLGMEWTYGLEILPINGEDGWKPLIGKVILGLCFLGFYEYCKWTDRK